MSAVIRIARRSPRRSVAFCFLRFCFCSQFASRVRDLFAARSAKLFRQTKPRKSKLPESCLVSRRGICALFARSSAIRASKAQIAASKLVQFCLSFANSELLPQKKTNSPNKATANTQILRLSFFNGFCFFASLFAAWLAKKVCQQLHFRFVTTWLQLALHSQAGHRLSRERLRNKASRNAEKAASDFLQARSALRVANGFARRKLATFRQAFAGALRDDKTHCQTDTKFGPLSFALYQFLSLIARKVQQMRSKSGGKALSKSQLLATRKLFACESRF